MGRRALIAPQVVSEPDHERPEVPVALTREQIKTGPGVETDMPVSRVEEQELFGDFGWPPHWFGDSGGLIPIDPPPDTDAGANAHDPNLRNANEILSYSIGTDEGPSEAIVGTLLDSDARMIRYLMADTARWLSSRPVAPCPAWSESIDWQEREVWMPLSRDQLRRSPEYDTGWLMERSFEQALFEHHRMPPYCS